MRGSHVATLAVLLVAAAAAAADPPAIEGPDQVAGHKLVRLSAGAVDAKNAGYIWDVYPFEKADVEESPGGKIVFTGPPGEYAVTLRVVDFEGGKILPTVRKTVTIGDSPAPPTPPGPTPPGPTPPPKPDVDLELRKRLKEAFDKDDGEDRDSARKDLAELYRQAAKLVKDESVVTTEDLLSRLRAAAAALAEDRLYDLRVVLAGLVAEALPLGDSLTPARRTAAAGLFVRIATALDW